MGSCSGYGYESPMVKQELAKLDKGGDKRRSALVSLRACVDKLDAATMPRFLSQLSDSPSRDHSESRPYAISLYQDVARVHGKLLAPFIPRIMTSVIRSLTSSGSSIHLHDACSKVVASIARYTILPNSSSAEVESVFQDLCNPLLEVLVGKLEPLAAGAAICLQALVESDKWKYAPPELIAELCAKCSLALKERQGQTVGHMHLARALVRLNVVTPECGLAFLRSSKEILKTPCSWQQKASALQLVRGLMLGLDRKSLASESESIAHIMEQIRLDRMPHVRNEAVKALQTLKAVVSEDEDGCNTTRMLLASAEKLDATHRCRSLWDREAPSSGSQESQLISFSPPQDSPASSPHSTSRLKRSSSSSASSVRARQRRTAGSSSSSSSASSDVFDMYTAAEAAAVSNNKLDQQQIVKRSSLQKLSEADESKENGRKSQVMENLRYQSSRICTTSNAAGDQCVVSSESYTMEVPDCLDVTATAIDQLSGGIANQECLSGVTEELATCTPLTPFSARLTPERSSAALLTAEDFIRFTTPRRLVRSLQTLASPDTPTSAVTTEAGTEEVVAKDDTSSSRGSLDLELLEASSETGWSVRDNPIADQHIGEFDNSKFQERSWDPADEEVEEDDETEEQQQQQQEQQQQAAETKRSSEALKLKMVMKQQTWEKTRGFLELVLGGCLCIVLLLPVAMAIIQMFDFQDSGCLVPT